MVALLLAGDLHVANAEEPDARAAAADAANGAKQLKARDFRRAAESYESAFHHQPNPKWLLLAARARQRGGDVAEAANHFAQLLKQTPEKSAPHAAARRQLTSLQASLGRVEVVANGAADVTLDGRPIDRAVTPVYTRPGSHVIEGHFGAETVTESFVVGGGQLANVVLERPTPPPATVAIPAASPEPPPVPVHEHRSPLPPTVVWIGIGATALFGGLTVASGIDVQNHKDTFDGNRSQANLDAGQSKQLRTNILFAVTGAAAAFTAVAALFFVEWKGTGPTPSKVQVSAGPGSATLTATF
jgi:hypothetical protein